MSNHYLQATAGAMPCAGSEIWNLHLRHFRSRMRANSAYTRVGKSPAPPTRCYHHRRDETADRWPGIRSRAPHCGPHGRAAPCGQRCLRFGHDGRHGRTSPGAQQRTPGRPHHPRGRRQPGQGGIVFLEVTGVFFLLFVLVFGNWTWKVRASYAHGPDHTKFLVYAAMTLVFLYLTVSSFWRARKR
jgi:hypothetical protein